MVHELDGKVFRAASLKTIKCVLITFFMLIVNSSLKQKRYLCHYLFCSVLYLLFELVMLRILWRMSGTKSMIQLLCLIFSFWNIRWKIYIFQVHYFQILESKKRNSPFNKNRGLTSKVSDLQCETKNENEESWRLTIKV